MFYEIRRYQAQPGRRDEWVRTTMIAAAAAAVAVTSVVSAGPAMAANPP